MLTASQWYESHYFALYLGVNGQINDLLRPVTRLAGPTKLCWGENIICDKITEAGMKLCFVFSYVL